MSSQKGNTARTRPQKHKNRSAFKNTLHDTSQRTKMINNLQVRDVCERCKEIIEWKIKYKKYKPLTQPKNCIKCQQKTVKKAYHIMCDPCGRTLGICTKCQTKIEVQEPVPDASEQLKLDNEMKMTLQFLPERKRRTFLRYMEKQNSEKSEDTDESIEVRKEKLVNKLNALKVGTEDFDEFSDDFDSEGDGDNNSSCSESEGNN